MSHLSSEDQLSIYKLTLGQSALWYLYHTAPDSGAYNVGCAWKITTGYDQDALLSVLHYLVERHSMWRSTFVLHEGKPVQRCHAQLPLDVEIIVREDSKADQLAQG